MKKYIIASIIIMLLFYGCTMPSTGKNTNTNTSNNSNLNSNTDATTEIQNHDNQTQDDSNGISNPEGINIYLDITNDANLFFAKYDISIYVDGTYVGAVKNGDIFTKKINTNIGNHTLTVMSADNNKIHSEKNYSINNDSTVKCVLKAHESSIEFLSDNIENGIQGNEIVMPDLFGMMLPDAKKQLQSADLKNITTNTNNSETIIMDSNWIVFEQNISSGDIIDRGTNVVLTCGRISDFIDKYISIGSLNETVEKFQKYGFTIEYIDSSNNQKINNLQNETSYDNWMLIDYEATSKNNKIVKLKLMFNGIAEVPSVVKMTADKAKEKLFDAHFPNVVFIDDNDKIVEYKNEWIVVEQSVEPFENISTSTTIRLKVKDIKSFKDVSFEFPATWNFAEKTDSLASASNSDDTFLQLGYNLYNGKEELSKSIVEKIIKNTASPNDKLKNISTKKTTIGADSIDAYACEYVTISSGNEYKNIAYVFRANGDLYIACYICLEEKKYDSFLENVKKINNSISIKESKYTIVENNDNLAKLVAINKNKTEDIKELVSSLKNKTIKIDLVVKDFELIKGTRFKYTFLPVNNGKINKNGPLFYFSDIGYVDFRFKSGNRPESLDKNICITCYIKISDYKDGKIYVTLDNKEHSEYVGKFN